MKTISIIILSISFAVVYSPSFGQVGSFRFKSAKTNERSTSLENIEESDKSVDIQAQKVIEEILIQLEDAGIDIDPSILQNIDTTEWDTDTLSRGDIPPSDTSNKGTVRAGVAGEVTLDEINQVFHEEFASIARAREEEINEDYSKKHALLVSNLNNEKDPRELRKIKDQVDALKVEREEELKLIVELKNFSKEYKYKARTEKRLFDPFPVRNVVDAQLYYNTYVSDKKAKFLSQSVILYSPEAETSSIFNEIYADYFGPIRLGFGALISNNGVGIEDSIPTDNTEELQEDAVQRILGGGGNAVLGLGYPLLNYNDQNELFFIKLHFAPKFAVDAPRLGTESTDYSFNTNIGFEGVTYYTGILDIITLFGNYRYSLIDGNKKFHEYLAKPSEDAFSLNQISIGMAINSTFRLSWNYYWGGGFVNNTFPSTVSFSVIPNF